MHFKWLSKQKHFSQANSSQAKRCCLSLFTQEAKKDSFFTFTHTHLQTQAAKHSLSPTLFLATTIFYGRIQNLVSANFCWNTFIRCLNLTLAFSGWCGQQTLHLSEGPKPGLPACLPKDGQACSFFFCYAWLQVFVMGTRQTLVRRQRGSWNLAARHAKTLLCIWNWCQTEGLEYCSAVVIQGHRLVSLYHLSCRHAFIQSWTGGGWR